LKRKHKRIIRDDPNPFNLPAYINGGYEIWWFATLLGKGTLNYGNDDDVVLVRPLTKENERQQKKFTLLTMFFFKPF
jgi:hypothetical protein